MKRMSRLLAVAIVCAGATALGDDDLDLPVTGDESANYQVNTVISGLERPCGLVFHPQDDVGAPHELLLVESGTGRVLSVTPTASDELRPLVTGLATQQVEGLDVEAGPWSQGFITPTKLAVVGVDGRQVVVFSLAGENAPMTSEDVDHKVSLPNRPDEKSAPVLASIVVADTEAYVSCGSPGAAGEVFRAALVANRMEPPEPLMRTNDIGDLRWPTGLCLSPPGKMQFLVAGFAGELSDRPDSRLVFIIPQSGRVALDLPLPLLDIAALAYSPSGQLYAADLAWETDHAGGIYRLDDVRHEGRPACRAVKIAEIARPTSLLFDTSGALYVTAWGDDSDQGAIIKVTGKF